MNPAESARFTELVSRYLEGVLTGAQESELLDRLQVPEYAARFLEIGRVDREIAGLLAAPVADDILAGLVLQDIERTPAEVPAFSATGERQGVSPTRIKHVGLTLRRSPAWQWRIGGLAAALLVGISWLIYSLRGGGPAVVAHLKMVQGSVFVVGDQGRQPGKAGQPLAANQQVVTVGEESLAVVEYPDATRLELGGETAVNQLMDVAKADKRVFLAQGFVTVDAAPQPEGHPLVVATPQAEVVVLGTRFTLESEARGTQIEVAKGKVQLIRKADCRSIEVSQGQLAVAAPAGGEPNLEPLTAQPIPAGAVLEAARGIRLGHKGGTSSLAFSPDGKQLACCMWSDGIVRVWDLTGPRPGGPTEYLGRGEPGWTVRFSPDGQTLAAGGNGGMICLWDVASRKLLARLPHRHTMRAALWSPDGSTLATAGEDSAICLREPRSGKERAILRENEGRGWVGVFGLAFSPDGSRLASALSNRTVRVRPLPSGTPHLTLTGHTDIVRSVAYSPRNDLLASGSRNEVIVWDAPAGRERYRIVASDPVAFSPNGAILAVGGAVPTLRNPADGAVIARIEGHRGGIYAYAFSPDNRYLAIGSWYGIALLDLSASPLSAKRR